LWTLEQGKGAHKHKLDNALWPEFQPRSALLVLAPMLRQAEGESGPPPPKYERSSGPAGKSEEKESCPISAATKFFQSLRRPGVSA
jgi:hypothetical protein